MSKCDSSHAMFILASLLASTALARQATTQAQETTPASLPGAQTYVYRDGEPEPMRLHVFTPAGWKQQDRRAALVFFFGGGFNRGTPERSAGWARWAAALGMVGIAPDYRTRDRFGTSAVECVADARAALRWVQDHADQIGVAPDGIVVGGSSAGGHLALWTAIEHTPPGSDANESPRFKPAALVLVSAPSDTFNSARAPRFGRHAEALSPLQHLDAKMPPVLAFHGDADTVVVYNDSVLLNRKLQETGNVCQFITVRGGSHSFISEKPEWKDKTRTLIEQFLIEQKILPAAKQ